MSKQYKRKLSHGKPWHYLIMGAILLLAALVFTVNPQRAGTANATTAAAEAVAFANGHWQCANISCSSTVKDGVAQPNYECAEFVARSLIAAGLMPGLTTTSSQSALGSYKSAGTTYDLNLISPMAGMHTIADYLFTSPIGGKNIGTNFAGAAIGDVVVFKSKENGETTAEPHHVALITQLGTDAENTYVDAHNNAHYHKTVSYIEGNTFSSYYILHLLISTPVGGGCGIAVPIGKVPAICSAALEDKKM